MTIDGFLQFLGLIVAVYALLSVVARYRFQLHGWRLWIPSLITLAAIVYLLLFDVVGRFCNANWCKPLELSNDSGLTPDKLAFLLVLAWLVYVAAVSKVAHIATRKLPLLASLVDRLVAEKRFAELADFIAPHTPLISQCARRQLPFQRLRTEVRLHRNPFHLNPKAPKSNSGHFEELKNITKDYGIRFLKPIFSLLPEMDKKEEASLRILRVLHTNEQLVEFIALERPFLALRLMKTGTYNFDFNDRVFDLMMGHPENQLRRETLINQTLEDGFFKIDPQNPLIHKLFSNASVAEDLQVWRPVGNYPLRLLERNTQNYRQTISAAKPLEDQLVHRDPSYAMIRFFDIMVRSAIRDGLSCHMWLMYFNLLVDKLLRCIDYDHPDYDPDSEFPNFGYYLIYEVFDVYGDWLRTIESCSADSPSMQIPHTPNSLTGSGIIHWVMVSMARSLKHIILSGTEDRYVAFIITLIMRDYKALSAMTDGNKFKEALRDQLITPQGFDENASYGERLKCCYRQIDHCIRDDTQDFEAALVQAYPD